MTSGGQSDYLEKRTIRLSGKKDNQTNWKKGQSDYLEKRTIRLSEKKDNR
jgi:hypothetical protein